MFSGTSISFPHLGITIDPSDGFFIGSFEIKWYGVIIAFGVLLAAIYTMRRCRQFGISQDELLNVILIGLPCGILGARLYYVVFEWDRFFGPNNNWYDFLKIRDGGLAIYGGVLGGALSLCIYCLCSKKRRGELLPVLDLCGFGLLIGQICGRWGNFFNREAFGSYTDSLFAMRVAADRVPSTSTELPLLLQKAQEGGYAGFVQVQPTFLYESVWNLIGFVLLHFLSKKRRFDGEIFLGYIAWYGLGRAIIEGMRTDSLYLGPLRVSQWVGGLSCLIALGIIVYVLAVRRPDGSKMLVNRSSAEGENENAAE